MLEIRLLQELVAFERYGTLSQAAQELHTSQPALTRSMKKLEDLMGMSLFIRSSNRLALNQTGQFMANHAARVLQDDQELIDRVRAFHRSLHTLSIAYCSSLPQRVLMPIINNIFTGMTISSDMRDDQHFIDHLKTGDYQLAVTHYHPNDPAIYYKKIGHEDLYISLSKSDSMAFYPQIHLQDLNGLSILRLFHTGFWDQMCREKLPDSHFLLQVERRTFEELAQNSDYPSFVSGYDIKRGLVLKNQLNVPVVDPDCHVSYYLLCLKRQQKRFQPLFKQVNAKTID